MFDKNLFFKLRFCYFFMKKLCKILALSSLGMFGLGMSLGSLENCSYVREIKVNTSENNVVSNENEAFFLRKYNGFKDPIGNELRNNLENNVFDIYFHHDESSLTQNDLVDIGRYFREVLVPSFQDKKFSNLNITGYANYVGDEDYNYLLSLERAKNVSDIFKKKLYAYFPFEVDVRVSAFGERRE